MRSNKEAETIKRADVSLRYGWRRKGNSALLSVIQEDQLDDGSIWAEKIPKENVNCKLQDMLVGGWGRVWDSGTRWASWNVGYPERDGGYVKCEWGTREGGQYKLRNLEKQENLNGEGA